MVVYKHIPSANLSLSAGRDVWILENIPALTALFNTNYVKAVHQPSMKSSPSYLKLVMQNMRMYSECPYTSFKPLQTL